MLDLKLFVVQNIKPRMFERFSGCKSCCWIFVKQFVEEIAALRTELAPNTLWEGVSLLYDIVFKVLSAEWVAT